MNSRLSCAWLMRQRNSLIAAFVLLLAIPLLAVPAAAGTPDWVRALDAQPTPTVSPEVSAVILHDEQITTLRNNGEMTTLYRRAYRILRPQGRKFANLG